MWLYMYIYIYIYVYTRMYVYAVHVYRACRVPIHARLFCPILPADFWRTRAFGKSLRANVQVQSNATACARRPQPAA